MKKILIIIVCLFLVGCGEKKTRGLLMEINLDAKASFVWRCQTDDQTVIKITEENFVIDKNNELLGQYQFRFVGAGLGKTTITCNYLDDDEVIDTNKFYFEVDENKFIKYIKKEGNEIEKISDPLFK